MAYESFYEGGYSALDSEFNRKEKDDLLFGFRDVRVSAGNLSMATDPRTANQIAEVTTKLNTGVKNIEVSVITPEVFESIPEQHLEEINRISKLTGVDISVHGLLLEPSGITQQGYSEVNREGIERQMLMNVERASKISPGGVITFHSTSGVPEAVETVLVKDDEGRLIEKKRAVVVIDPRTGRMAPLRDVTERYFPQHEGQEFTGKLLAFDPKTELNRINEESWRDQLRNLNFNVIRGNESVTREGSLVNDAIMREVDEQGLEVLDKFGPEKKLAEGQYYQRKEGEQILRSAYREMRELFDLAYKKAKENAEKTGNKSDLQKLKEFASDIKINKLNEKSKEYDSSYLPEVVREGANILGKVENPNYYVPLHDFVLEKSSTTFGDVAFKAYEKLGDKAPIVSIENPPAGSGFSKAEDIKQLIEASRDKFVQNAVQSGKYSRSEAKEASEKMIGATWDVGHINMLKKYGYTDKELIKQAETIAPFVKHVHLSDNFGMDHTELPMGMGNVPFKEELKAIKKAGFEGKQVVEVGNWWQHFKTPPIGETLEALGSPLYSMRMSPYWNQIRATYGNYFSGYGPILPEQHFSMYGAGFSSLPQELGGQVPGKQSRFSGAPNE